MTFGSRAGDNIRNDLKNASGSGSFLTTLKDGKDLRVRFLQEPEDWYKFKEHYSQATNFFPCTQNERCPGCQGELRASKRYVASVLDVAQGKVVPLKMPIDLANRVTNKCDRNGGTLLDRDFTLIRTGKGISDTTYDVEAEDKTQVDISRYEKVDPEPILEQIFHDAFGDNPQPVKDTSPQTVIADLQAQLAAVKDAQEAPKVQSGQVRLLPGQASVPGATPMEQKKNLEESGVATSVDFPTQTLPASGGDSPKAIPTPGNGSEPTGEGFVSLEQLNQMDGPTLRQFVTDNGLKPPDSAFDRQSLLDWLLSEFGVE